MWCAVRARARLHLDGGGASYEQQTASTFAAALADVPVSIHLGAPRDETARLATWHVSCGAGLPGTRLLNRVGC